jgi:hypothetical protein
MMKNRNTITLEDQTHERRNIAPLVFVGIAAWSVVWWFIPYITTILTIFFAIYFVPMIVAGVRHHHNRMAISVLNVFLGWTLIGWVVALVWACTRSEQETSIVQQN